MLFYMPNTKNYWLLIRDVKIVFFWYSILGTKNSIFFDYRISADARNWFRQVSSTDDESGCASSMRWRFVGGYVCSSTSQSSPAASAAALVHSSNSHCLAHTNFSAPNSFPRWVIVDQRLLRRRTGAHQLLRDKTDIKWHLAAVCLLHSPSQITANYYQQIPYLPIRQCSEWILTDIRYPSISIS